jgi:hypothetical protein
MTSHGLRCAAGKTALHGMGEMRRPTDLVRFAKFAGAMIEVGCLEKYLRNSLVLTSLFSIAVLIQKLRVRPLFYTSTSLEPSKRQ